MREGRGGGGRRGGRGRGRWGEMVRGRRGGEERGDKDRNGSKDGIERKVSTERE